MPIEVPACCDDTYDLLRKILLSLSSTGNPISVRVDDEGVPLTAAVADINFVGAGVTATAVGNNVTVTIPGSQLQSGSQAIGSGVDTISVVFPVAFAAVPSVVGSISRPAANPLIEFNIDEASITVNGFTASLGATTPNANYKLKWMAN